MGPFTATFVAYGVTVVLAAAGVFGLLGYDGAILSFDQSVPALIGDFALILASTVGFTFVPWAIWRHLQPVDTPPQYAAPAAALVGLALSDLYLMFVSAMGGLDPVDNQLFFMVSAAVLGGILGPTYGVVERLLRRRYVTEQPQG